MINKNIKKDIVSFEVKGSSVIFTHEAIYNSGKAKKYTTKRTASEVLKAFREASKASTKDNVNGKWLAIRALLSNDIAKDLSVDSQGMKAQLCRKTKYDACARNVLNACELLASKKDLALVDTLAPKYNTQAKRLNVKSKTEKKHVKKAVVKKTAKQAKPELAIA